MGAAVAAKAIGGVAQGFANAAARDSLEEAQALNLAGYQNYIENITNLWNQSRGSQGTAVQPLYAKDFESPVLYRTAEEAFRAGLSPTDTLARYEAAAAANAPTVAAARQTAADIFSGRLSAEQVANMAPVYQANLAAAETQKEGILEGLSQRLNQLAAQRAARGYVGSGSGTEKAALTTATIPALQAAAATKANALTQNEASKAGILNTGLQFAAQNVNLPQQMAANAIGLAALPQQQATQTFASKLAPFNFFRIAQTTPNIPAPPAHVPIPSDAQIALQGVSDFFSVGGGNSGGSQLLGFAGI